MVQPGHVILHRPLLLSLVLSRFPRGLQWPGARNDTALYSQWYGQSFWQFRKSGTARIIP